MLIAALSLLLYNLFYKDKANNQSKTLYTDTKNITTTDTDIGLEDKAHKTINEVKEPKKSDIAIQMGDNIEIFNTASSIVYEFIEHLNALEYQEAYNMFNSEYADELALPYEAFKEKYTFTTEKVFKGEKLISSDYGVIISGSLIDYFGGEAEDIENSVTPYSFTLFNTEPYTIADIGIKTISELNKTITLPKKDVSINIYKQINTADGIIIYATISNNGTEVFQLSMDNYGFHFKNGNNTYPHKLLSSIFTDYELEPKETKHYKIYFLEATEIQSIGVKLKDGEIINLGGI